MLLKEKGGQKQFWECLGFISGWPCLSLSECRQIAYCKQREEASGRHVPTLQWTSLREPGWPLKLYSLAQPSSPLGPWAWVCVWLQNFLSTPLLLQFLLHRADPTAMCSKLLKLGVLNSNPNSPLTLISMNRELMEVCEDEMRRWAKALWAVPGTWETTPFQFVTHRKWPACQACAGPPSLLRPTMPLATAHILLHEKLLIYRNYSF